MALIQAPVSSSAIGVAEDLVRAGMFKTFATSATKALKASDAVLTVNAGEHMMSKEEIDKVVKFQTSSTTISPTLTTSLPMQQKSTLSIMKWIRQVETSVN